MRNRRNSGIAKALFVMVISTFAISLGLIRSGEFCLAPSVEEPTVADDNEFKETFDNFVVFVRVGKLQFKLEHQKQSYKSSENCNTRQYAKNFQSERQGFFQYHSNVDGRAFCAIDETTDMSLDNASSIIHVMICSDANTLGGMIALINSIHLHTNSTVIFHLVTDQNSYDHLHSWIDGTELKGILKEIIVFDTEIVKGKYMMRSARQSLGNPLNYARFYIPYLMPGFNGRLVYIDDDCIVQGDIKELAETRLHELHLAAFSDDCSMIAGQSQSKQEGNKFAYYLNYANELVQNTGIDPQTCSFNVGVFVTDVGRWKEYSVTDKLEYWMELNVRENIYRAGGSQPPMLIVFHGKYSTMDAKWHVRCLGVNSSFRFSREILRNARLLHWSGSLKPWGAAAKYTDIWDQYFIEDPTAQFQVKRQQSMR